MDSSPGGLTRRCSTSLSAGGGLPPLTAAATAVAGKEVNPLCVGGRGEEGVLSPQHQPFGQGGLPLPPRRSSCSKIFGRGGLTPPAAAAVERGVNPPGVLRGHIYIYIYIVLCIIYYIYTRIYIYTMSYISYNICSTMCYTLYVMSFAALDPYKENTKHI